MANHRDYDCFGCAILSHGMKDEMIWAKDKAVKLSEITDLFNAKNSPSLQLKPKLFFIAVSRYLLPRAPSNI